MSNDVKRAEQLAEGYADERLELGLISLEQLWEMLHQAYLAGWSRCERDAWTTAWQQYAMRKVGQR